MELTTILNRCHHFRGFVYKHARFSTDKKSIVGSSRVDLQACKLEYSIVSPK